MPVRLSSPHTCSGVASCARRKMLQR